MNNYTPEDLLLYLYNETSAEATAAIEQALETDWTLREKLAVLKASKKRLDTLVESPRTEVVLSVMRYAAATQKETLPH
jgi:anti-sigma factor RsiW